MGGGACQASSTNHRAWYVTPEINDLVLHPEAATDEKLIQEEIIWRDHAHFVVDDESAKAGTTLPPCHLATMPFTHSYKFVA